MNFTKYMIKIITFSIVINGAFFVDSLAKSSFSPSPSPVPKTDNQDGKKCYDMITTECQNGTFKAMCQDPYEPYIPIMYSINYKCCFELFGNNLFSNDCLSGQMAEDAAINCKLDPIKVKKRSNQIALHCVDEDTYV